MSSSRELMLFKTSATSGTVLQNWTNIYVLGDERSIFIIFCWDNWLITDSLQKKFTCVKKAAPSSRRCGVVSTWAMLTFHTNQMKLWQKVPLMKGKKYISYLSEKQKTIFICLRELFIFVVGTIFYTPPAMPCKWWSVRTLVSFLSFGK